MSSTALRKFGRYGHGALRVFFGAVCILFALISLDHDEPLRGVPAAHEAFEQAIITSGYMFPAIGVVEIIVGAMLIANRWVALALILLAPISINYVLFKVFLDPSTLIVPGVFALLNLFFAIGERRRYQPLLKFSNAG